MDFFLGEKVTFTLDESPLDAVFGWFLPKQNFQSCEECCFIVSLFKGYSKVALFPNLIQLNEKKIICELLKDHSFEL